MIGSQINAKIFSSYLNNIQKKDDSGKESEETSVENTDPARRDKKRFETEICLLG